MKKNHVLLQHFQESHKNQKKLSKYENNFDDFKGSTSLSSYVSKLFSENSVEETIKEEIETKNLNYLKNGFLNWNLLKKNEYEDLTSASLFIKKIMKNFCCLEISTDEFKDLYQETLSTIDSDVRKIII